MTWYDKALEKSKYVGDCLVFNGTNIHGYGYVWLGKKYKRIHKLSYEKFKGEIQKGLVVRHTCDVRNCWNPEHLVIGTQADNMKDMTDKERSARGILNARAKLTDSQVLEIKELLKTNLTQEEIAQRYDIHQSMVSLIKLDKNWKHIEKENI